MNAPIRHARPADCAEIALLVQKYWVFEGIGGFNRDRVVALLHGFLSHSEQGRCWVVGNSGELRGYLLATYLFSLEYGGTAAEIDELYVLDPYRASGLGTRLVQEAVADMKRSGIVYVQLQLGAQNRLGRAFYRRQGFTERAGYELLGRVL